MTNIVQFFGSWLGIFLAYTVKGEDRMVFVTVNPDYSHWYIFYVEIIISFMMVTAALHVKVDELTLAKENVLKEILFCVAVFAAAGVGGPYSGGCLSPQLCTSEVTFEAMMKADTESYDKMGLVVPWIFGPYVGGILAGLFTKYISIPSWHRLEDNQVA